MKHIDTIIATQLPRDHAAICRSSCWPGCDARMGRLDDKIKLGTLTKNKKIGRKFTRNLYNKTLEHGPFIDYLPRTMAIFPGFVKLPEGNMWMDVLKKKTEKFHQQKMKISGF